MRDSLRALRIAVLGHGDDDTAAAYLVARG
jgi:hypothetical protein